MATRRWRMPLLALLTLPPLLGVLLISGISWRLFDPAVTQSSEGGVGGLEDMIPPPAVSPCAIHWRWVTRSSRKTGQGNGTQRPGIRGAGGGCRRSSGGPGPKSAVADRTGIQLISIASRSQFKLWRMSRCQLGQAMVKCTWASAVPS